MVLIRTAVLSVRASRLPAPSALRQGATA
jgi:hypothetical protein